jgi:hypothetical protein
MNDNDVTVLRIAGMKIVIPDQPDFFIRVYHKKEST